MRHVLIALAPAVACALWFFGLPALWVLVTSVASCVATEWLITRYMLRRPEQALDQHVERIRAQVGQEEQGDAQMSDGQADE